MVIWKRIDDFPDYEVSTDGRVRSYRLYRWLAYPGEGPPIPLKLRPFHLDKAHSYLYVDLCKTLNGQRFTKRFGVHRLVALTFIPNPEGKGVVAHNNGKADDNRVSNLRWATTRENALDRAKHGTAYRGSDHPGAVLTEAIVRRIRKRLKRRKRGDIVLVSKEFGVSQATIRRALYGDSWAHVKTETSISEKFSTHTAKKVHAAINQHGGWATANEIAALADVSGRSARVQLPRLANLGIVELEKSRSAHRYRIINALPKNNFSASS